MQLLNRRIAACLPIIGSVIICVLLYGFSSNRQLDGIERAILDEILSSDDRFTALSPNRDAIYFIAAEGPERMICRIGLTNVTTRKWIKDSEEVWSISKWSPDDQLLVFQKKLGGKNLRLYVYDRIADRVSPLTNGENIEETRPVWLGTRSIWFKALNPRGSVEDLIYDVEMKSAVPPSSSKSGEWIRHSNQNDGLLQQISGHRRLLRAGGGEIIVIDGDVRYPVLQGQSQNIEWLNGNESLEKFLFCKWSETTGYREVFLATLGSTNIEKLESRHSYNPKWLGREDGFAVVVNTNNCFSLQVVSWKYKYATNIFSDGWCRTFTPDPSGERVFAEASVDNGPCGLWMFEMKTRRLVEIERGNSRDFHGAIVIPPVVTSFLTSDGYPIPVYEFKARSDVPFRGTVIGIPPKTDQASRYYQARPQLLANLGFNFVWINYRGVDGYGFLWSRLYSSEAAARDVIEVVADYLKRGDVKQAPIIISCQSQGGEVLAEVLKMGGSTNVTAAVAIRSVVPWEGQFNCRIPWLFVYGEMDNSIHNIEKSIQQLEASGADVEVTVLENYEHLNVSPKGRREEEGAVAAFCAKLVGAREFRLRWLLLGPDRYANRR